VPLLDMFRRKAAPAPPAVPVTTPPEPGVPIDATTEDWRIRGRVDVQGRLLDALNRREAITIVSVDWAPVDGSKEFEPVPGLRTIDPYDLLLVFARPETMPSRTLEASAAHRRVKESFDVLLDVPPFQVAGTVHLFPGLLPDTLLDHGTDLFAALTGAVAHLAGATRIGPPEPSTILVNRSYITHVEQVDEVTMRAVHASRSGEPAQRGEEA
jgi:hypothetical protein